MRKPYQRLHRRYAAALSWFKSSVIAKSRCGVLEQHEWSAAVRRNLVCNRPIFGCLDGLQRL